MFEFSNFDDNGHSHPTYIIFTRSNNIALLKITRHVQQEDKRYPDQGDPRNRPDDEAECAEHRKPGDERLQGVDRDGIGEKQTLIVFQSRTKTGSEIKCEFEFYFRK